jgi:putative membrane protein insertion efficiency factor
MVRSVLEKGITLLALGIIWLYRATLRPLFPPHCRFEPTCSEYATQAIRAWGPFQGILLALRRLIRCHPFSPGGYDPVPARRPR